jgi:hypothetical protein
MIAVFAFLNMSLIAAVAVLGMCETSRTPTELLGGPRVTDSVARHSSAEGADPKRPADARGFAFEAPEQGDDQAGPGRAQREPEGDRPAVGVDDARFQFQFTHA